MDYTRFQVERMVDGLRRNGVPVPGQSTPPPLTTEAPNSWETEAIISKSSRSKKYLPQWLYDHRYDPAMMVTYALHLMVTIDDECNRASQSCCSPTSKNDSSQTRATLNRCSSRTIASMSTRFSTSSIPPMKCNVRWTSSTWGTTKRASWYTLPHLRRTSTNHGCMRRSLQSSTSPYEPFQIPNQKTSQFCGFDGWNAAHLVWLDLTRITTLTFLSSLGPALLGAHSTLWIQPTSSVGVISSPPSTSDELMIFSIHPLLGTHREIGVLTT